MSQDHLFSTFKRSRETIAGGNSVPMYNSAIPQPASTLKRSNSSSASRGSSIGGAPRMSLAPRTGFGRPSNADDLGGTIKRDSKVFSARKSYAPSASQPPPGSTRRSSLFRRSSVGGPAFSQANSFFNSTISASVPRDPRPLKDRSYQARIAQQIHEYLLQNGFEMDMKYTLSANALKSPTQRDFTSIFQWLYNRLDPNYRFLKTEKKVENEVLTILKSLRYPYTNSITKSQLAAVGSANSWPLILGMLHWMMELIMTIDRYQSGDFDEAATQAGVDIGADKTIFRYLTRCYSAFLAADDNHQDYLQEMALFFDERKSGYMDELQMLEEENLKFKEELEKLDENANPLQRLEDTRKLLEDDTRKFVEYMDLLEQKKQKTEAFNNMLKDEIAKVVKELKELEDEKQGLQEAVDAQGLTPEDIDRMNTEREKLSKGIQQVSQKLSEARTKLTEREIDAQSKIDALERAVTRYNSLAYQIGIDTKSAPNASGKEFTLQILPLVEPLDGSQGEADKLILDAVTGYQPSQLLSHDLRHNIKPALNRLRQEIGARIHDAQDEFIKTQEYIDKIGEAISDKNDEVEALEARVARASEEYNELKDTMEAEGNASNTEIEKLERGLQTMRIGMSNGALSLEQRMQSVTIEYDQLEHAIKATRDKLHSEVEKILNDVIKFKIHVQEGLEEYEALVEDEVNGNAKLLEG